MVNAVKDEKKVRESEINVENSRLSGRIVWQRCTSAIVLKLQHIEKDYLTFYRPLAVQQHTHIRPATQAPVLFRFRLSNTDSFHSSRTVSFSNWYKTVGACKATQLTQLSKLCK